MLSRWRQRKERQQQVIRDADNLMALFGERAYSAALGRARHEDENGRASDQTKQGGGEESRFARSCRQRITVP